MFSTFSEQITGLGNGTGKKVEPISGLNHYQVNHFADCPVLYICIYVCSMKWGKQYIIGVKRTPETKFLLLKCTKESVNPTSKERKKEGARAR